MAFTLWLAHIVRLRAGNLPGFISLITFWLGYEYISLNINIISPWLNLGNGLSKDILFIQWYEVTGTAGGSLWILMLQSFPYNNSGKFFYKKRQKRIFFNHLALDNYYSISNFRDQIFYNKAKSRIKDQKY